MKVHTSRPRVKTSINRTKISVYKYDRQIVAHLSLIKNTYKLSPLAVKKKRLTTPNKKRKGSNKLVTDCLMKRYRDSFQKPRNSFGIHARYTGNNRQPYSISNGIINTTRQIKNLNLKKKYIFSCTVSKNKKRLTSSSKAIQSKMRFVTGDHRYKPLADPKILASSSNTLEQIMKYQAGNHSFRVHPKISLKSNAKPRSPISKANFRIKKVSIVSIKYNVRKHNFRFKNNVRKLNRKIRQEKIRNANKKQFFLLRNKTLQLVLSYIQNPLKKKGSILLKNRIENYSLSLFLKVKSLKLFLFRSAKKVTCHTESDFFLTL